MVLHALFKGVIAATLLALPSATFALTSTDFTALGGVAASDQLGRAVASGDINGDGYDDIVAGAPNNATGYISIVYGSSTLPSATTLSTSNSVIITGNGSSDNFGVSLAIGDINGDGYDDIAVGATADTTAGSANSGAAYLLYGGAEQLQSGAATSLASMAKFYNGHGFKTGGAVSFGDLNGDGFDDLLVGSTNDAATGGSVSIIYGSATLYTGSSNGIAGLPKFTGEASANAFGNSIDMGDVNGDGYDDALIAAALNNDGATAAGAAYVFYGQSGSYTGSTSASTVAEFTGEAQNDQAGTMVAIQDVTGDGYAEMLVSAPGNDDGASDAGSVYLIPGSVTPYTSTASLSTYTQYTGVTSSDAIDKISAIDIDNDGTQELIIGARTANTNSGIVYILGGNTPSGSLSSATSFAGTNSEKFGTALSAGDINGDGFTELLVGAQSYNSSAGAVYAAVFLIDEDIDGVAGSGLMSSLNESYVFDCNDADDTVSAEQTYYADADADGLGELDSTTSACSSTAPDGYTTNSNDTNDTIPNNGVEIGADGVDNDEDGEIDESNTVDTNGEHPYYGSLSPTDNEAVTSNITSIEGAPAGVITVTYADGSVYDYTVLTTSTAKNTLVRQYKTTGYGVVLDRKGKKIVLVNLYNGALPSSKPLSKKSVDKAGLLLKDVRNDNKTEAVVTTVRNKKAKLYIIKVNVGTETLKIKDSAVVESGKVSATKTRVKKSLVSLRTNKGKVVATFKVNKKYQLIAQQ